MFFFKLTESTIKNPEVYLDDPENVCFETIVKNRIYELVRTHNRSFS